MPWSLVDDAPAGERMPGIPGDWLSTHRLPAWGQDLRVGSIFDEESVKTAGCAGPRPDHAPAAEMAQAIRPACGIYPVGVSAEGYVE